VCGGDIKTRGGDIGTRVGAYGGVMKADCAGVVRDEEGMEASLTSDLSLLPSSMGSFSSACMVASASAGTRIGARACLQAYRGQ